MNTEKDVNEYNEQEPKKKKKNTEFLGGSKSRKQIVAIINIIICAASILLLSTVFAPCSEGMKCVEQTLVVKVLFGFIGVISLFIILFNHVGAEDHSYLLELFNLMLMCGLFIYWKGGCKVETMACQIYTFPYIRFVTIVLLFVWAIDFTLWKIFDD